MPTKTKQTKQTIRNPTTTGGRKILETLELVRELHRGDPHLPMSAISLEIYTYNIW